jgi:hypothetical protein|tara:strand:+ start:24 stop:479 length:456 start_codon:yes stop_codon:yes gene_type:complete
MKTILKLVFILVILTSCNQNEINSKNIQGKWKVYNSNVIPFSHPSSCQKLDTSSIFEFTSHGIPKIFPTNKDTNCILYQSFKIVDSTLIFHEIDISFKYQILKLNKDTLFLQTRKIPHYIFETPYPEQGNKLKEIKKNGINIKLLKISNGG